MNTRIHSETSQNQILSSTDHSSHIVDRYSRFAFTKCLILGVILDNATNVPPVVRNCEVPPNDLRRGISSIYKYI